MPIAGYQSIEGDATMGEDDPQFFALHSSVAGRVEEIMGGTPHEIEATYTRTQEGKIRIYVLQTNRMEFRKGKIARFKEVCDSITKVIVKGVGINGGALSGVALFSIDPQRIKALKERFPDMPIIMIRRETNTRDVGVMPLVDGLLTVLGGATSHAAVQAQKFNLSCIVGCKGLKISGRGENLEASIGPVTIVEGDPINIDGASGLVYQGVCFEVQREFV